MWRQILFLFFVFTCVFSDTPKVNTITLRDGNKMPVLGLGTWLNGADNSNVQTAVEVAIDAGYRHIDTAAIYGTEEAIGKALQNKINAGVIKRNEIFITTKLWNDKHKESQVVPALRESLHKLGLDYVDLYLIHWPISVNEIGEFDTTDYINTWKGMVEAKRLGLTKSIGVSNFNINQLNRILDSSDEKPSVNQIEVNPNLAQKPLIKFCKDRGIEVTAYTPLGTMPLSKNVTGAPKPRLDDPTLKAIAAKYNKTVVQVVLRYLVDRGLITIPKSVTPSRIRENIDIFDFALTPEEVQTIDNFNTDYRTVSPDFWKESPFYPF